MEFDALEERVSESKFCSEATSPAAAVDAIKLDVRAVPFGYDGVGVSQWSSENDMMPGCACVENVDGMWVGAGVNGAPTGNPLVGRAVGVDDGNDVGLSDGEPDGALVGSELGCVGSYVGSVGSAVGRKVGRDDGSDVGLSDGEPDGDEVGGDVVGDDDGALVSDVVGDDDGAAVVGSDVIGDDDGDEVGSDVVGDDDGDEVGIADASRVYTRSSSNVMYNLKNLEPVNLNVSGDSATEMMLLLFWK